jgi:hypothetical protein
MKIKHKHIGLSFKSINITQYEMYPVKYEIDLTDKTISISWFGVLIFKLLSMINVCNCNNFVFNLSRE